MPGPNQAVARPPASGLLTPADLARRVRDVYVAWREVVEEVRGGSCDWGTREVPRRDGQAHPESAHALHEPVWPKVLRFAVAHGLDVRELVRAAFLARWGMRPADPDVLLSAAARDWYRRHAAAGPAAAARLRAELTWFVTERYTDVTGPAALGRPLPVGHVLADTSAPLGGLARYLLATHGGPETTGLPSRCAAEAVWDYLRDQNGCEAAIGDFIPERLRRQVRTLRAEILGGPAAAAGPPEATDAPPRGVEALLLAAGVLLPPAPRRGWTDLQAKAPSRPTGVPFADRLLPRGVSPGQVVGLPGAIGAGKTLLAGQLAWAAVRQEQAPGLLWPDATPGRVYYFSCEMPRDAMVRRLLALAAQIPEHAFDGPGAGQRTQRQPYEAERRAGRLAAFGEGALAAESERLAAAWKSLEDGLDLVDWREDDESRGVGLVAVASYLTAATQKSSRPWW
jgi:hypothetical protein